LTLPFYFLQGATLGLSAVATPGPFQAFLLAHSLKNGWRRTLPAALGPLVSDGAIIALVLLALTQTPAWFLTVLRLLGGFFILYLAWGAWRATRTAVTQLVVSPDAGGQSLLKAALMNLLNPNPYLFWSIIGGPIIIEGWQQSPAIGLGFMLGFYLMLISGNAGLIILFSTASQLGSQVSRILSVISAVALLGFGGYQLWQGVSALLG